MTGPPFGPSSVKKVSLPYPPRHRESVHRPPSGALGLPAQNSLRLQGTPIHIEIDPVLEVCQGAGKTDLDLAAKAED